MHHVFFDGSVATAGHLVRAATTDRRFRLVTTAAARDHPFLLPLVAQVEARWGNGLRLERVVGTTPLPPTDGVELLFQHLAEHVAPDDALDLLADLDPPTDPTDRARLLALAADYGFYDLDTLWDDA